MKLDHFRVNYKGCIRSTTSRSGVIFPLCSALLRPLRRAVPSGGSQYRRDTDTLEPVLPRVTTVVEEFEKLSHEERLRETGMFCLDKRRLRGITPMHVNTQWDGLKKMEPAGFQ